MGRDFDIIVPPYQSKRTAQVKWTNKTAREALLLLYVNCTLMPQSPNVLHQLH
jgi:hypothetical protein